MEEIAAAGNVNVRFDTRVVDGGGEGRLEWLVLEDRTSETRETVAAGALFVLIGAEPRTGRLPEEVARDEQGYVVTGQDLVHPGRFAGRWPLRRAPLLFESSLPGVFVAGDARGGSVKRVASAVGAGAIAVQLVHEYFIKTRLGTDGPQPVGAKRSDSAGDPANGAVNGGSE